MTIESDYCSMMAESSPGNHGDHATVANSGSSSSQPSSLPMSEDHFGGNNAISLPLAEPYQFNNG